MSREQIEQLLPSVVRRAIGPGSPLAALTAVMADLFDPADRAAGNLDGYFDPWRCPERFLPLLAAWMDIPMPVTTGSRQLRELIAVAVGLHQVRGTRRALLAFLEAATGLRGFEIDETVRDAAGQVRPFFVTVRAPAEARAHAVMIERLIERERPAQVRCELTFVSATPSPEDGHDR
ncbi:MAG TPA: phage tail protein [Kofleriaceae bacterium]|nr:phage tail protein [Kofleriaceae bacterium]